MAREIGSGSRWIGAKTCGNGAAAIGVGREKLTDGTVRKELGLPFGTNSPDGLVTELLLPMPVLLSILRSVLASLFKLLFKILILSEN